MNFKNECDVFLDKIVDMRNAWTEQAKNEAIARDHVPYAADLTAKRDQLIDEAKAEYEKNIAALAAVLQGKIAQYTADTETAISAHKTKIIAAVENDMKAKFDAFILGTSKLVDDSGIQ